MAQRLTDASVKRLAVPATGNKIAYDDKVRGFGVRVTAAGSRAFILNYRTRAGRERRFTIGAFPEWSTSAARVEAGELKKRIDRGEDPMAEFQANRDAKTVADLAARFEEEHLTRTRISTAAEYMATIRKDILPALGRLKVAEVTFADVDGLHRKVTKRAPIKANRTLAVLSKMFSLAIKWGWLRDNPTKGVERNVEHGRERYLTGEELARLTAALAKHPDQQAANIIRMLLLTGARRGEVRAARWEQFDLATGTWTKPAAAVKQNKSHRLPLSAPARQLLGELREAAPVDAEWVFPGNGSTGHRLEIKKDWAAICKAADLADIHVHDLRHSFASLLVSAGYSLPFIGALLGHSEVETTGRYAHLYDDVLREATERVGAIVSAKPKAEVLPINGAR